MPNMPKMALRWQSWERWQRPTRRFDFFNCLICRQWCTASWKQETLTEARKSLAREDWPPWIHSESFLLWRTIAFTWKEWRDQVRKRLQHAMQSAKLGGVWNHDSTLILLKFIKYIKSLPSRAWNFHGGGGDPPEFWKKNSPLPPQNIDMRAPTNMELTWFNMLEHGESDKKWQEHAWRVAIGQRALMLMVLTDLPWSVDLHNSVVVRMGGGPKLLEFLFQPGVGDPQGGQKRYIAINIDKLLLHYTI